MKTIGIVLTVILTMTTLANPASALVTGTSANTACMTGHIQIQHVGCATGAISHRVHTCDNTGCWVTLHYDLNVDPGVQGEFHGMIVNGELFGKTESTSDRSTHYEYGTHTVGDRVYVTDGAGTGRYRTWAPVNHTFTLSRQSAMMPSFGLYALPEAMEQADDLVALATDAVAEATRVPGGKPAHIWLP